MFNLPLCQQFCLAAVTGGFNVKIMQEFKLPDFLPSRFRTWLSFYYQIGRELEKAGHEINEETMVKYSSFTDYEEQEYIRKTFDEQVYFVTEFPITLIKARAFDEVIAKIPDYVTVQELKRSAMASFQDGERLHDFFNGILDVAPKNHR